eukprot:12789854-Ditylum_brightwellii.AAC.1
MGEFASLLSNNAPMGRINSALGTMELNLTNHECTLSSTILRKLSADTSGLDASVPTGVTAKVHQKIWSISAEEAAAAVDANTQLNRQSSESILSQHFSTNDSMLRYKQIDSIFFTDTLHVIKKATLMRGYRYLQVFVSDKGYIAVYSLEKKSKFKDALCLFWKEVGVPIALMLDPSGEQTSKEVNRFCNQVGTTLWILEESTQWANCCELYI